MAGAGYKLFQTGDVLTAAQVNTYLNEQTVMVFANAAARTSALTSVLAEGMMSYLQDTNSVEVYNGSSWVNVGNAGDITEVQAGTGISVASGTGPIPVITNTVATAFDAAGDLVYGTGADTFTKLSLGTAGQVLKVNSGATAPEWGAAAGGGFVGVFCKSTSGTISISNNTITAVTWNSEDFDTDGFHSTSSNTDRITIPSGKNGKYLFVAQLKYNENATGARQLRLNKNGTFISHGVVAVNSGSSSTTVNLSIILDLVATDYITVDAFQGSGGALDLLVDDKVSFFSAQFLGA